MHGHVWLPFSSEPSACFFLDRHYVLESVVTVGSRPRSSCYSLVRIGLAIERQLKVQLGQVPGGKVASGGKMASGSKVGRMYVLFSYR